MLQIDAFYHTIHVYTSINYLVERLGFSSQYYLYEVTYKGHQFNNIAPSFVYLVSPYHACISKHKKFGNVVGFE